MKYGFLFLILIGVSFMFYEALKTDPSVVPSNLISKEVPSFKLTKVSDYPLVDSNDLENNGQFKIVNFFASWCPPCKVEHPQLMTLSNSFNIFGIAKKDNEQNIEKWLKKDGNPFTKLGIDKDGLSSIQWGVYGLPETFLIDKNGNIIHKHVGPIMKKDLEKIESFLK